MEAEEAVSPSVPVATPEPDRERQHPMVVDLMQALQDSLDAAKAVRRERDAQGAAPPNSAPNPRPSIISDEWWETETSALTTVPAVSDRPVDAGSLHERPAP